MAKLRCLRVVFFFEKSQNEQLLQYTYNQAELSREHLSKTLEIVASTGSLTFRVFGFLNYFRPFLEKVLRNSNVFILKIKKNFWMNILSDIRKLQRKNLVTFRVRTGISDCIKTIGVHSFLVYQLIFLNISVLKFWFLVYINFSNIMTILQSENIMKTF